MTITPHPLIPASAVRAIDRLVMVPQRDDVCTIQRPVSGTDATGAPVGGFATVAVVPCEVRLPGRMPVESVGGASFASIVDYEVTFGREVSIDNDDQILVNGQTLKVIAAGGAASHGLQVRVFTRAVEG